MRPLSRRAAIVRFCLSALIAAGLTAGGAAAASPSLLTGYDITSWGRIDGLPPGNIWALAQDTRGYLWLGTDVGLVRFDGVRFVKAADLGLSTVPGSAVRALFVSRDGSLWIGHAKGGITRLRDGAVTTYLSADGQTLAGVGTIIEDRSGQLLAVAGGRLVRFVQDHWTYWDIAPGRSIRTVAVGSNGDLLLSAGREVLRRDASGALVATAHIAAPIQDLAQDRHGDIWITDPIVGFRPASRMIRDDARRGRGIGLLVDRQANLWVATFGQGVWRVSTDPRGEQSVALASDVTGLSNSSVLALLEDQDGNIWIGTADGLNRLRPDRLTHVTDLGLVTGVVTTPDGHVWAGTAEGVVELVQRGDTPRPIARYLRGLSTRGLHVDAAGVVWVATQRGVYRIQTGHGTVAPALVIDELQTVSGIISAHGGGLWLYDNTRGLVRWRNGRLEPWPLPAEFNNALVGALLTDSGGRTWIGYDDRERIVAIDAQDRLRVYGPGEGLESGLTRAFHEDRGGTIWVAGSRGIARLTGERFDVLRQGNDFISTLTSVVESPDGHLWLGSALGLVRINPHDFDRALAGTPPPVSYDLLERSDGVPGTTRWAGQPNVASTPDGQLWFLTVRGVTIVDPRALTRPRQRLPVEIDDVTVDGQRLDTAAHPTVGPNTRRMEINYTLPDLSSTRKRRFRYRLDGFDSEWVNAGTRRQAIYTNLPPRAYTFRVQAADYDGVWRADALLNFSVAPAFSQTPWFYGLLAVVGALIVGGWWQVRLWGIRNDFSLLLRERVRLSREIHDTLLQSLVGLSLQLTRLASDLERSSGGRDRVQQIGQQVDDYIRDARQSIWNLRSSTLEHIDLAGALEQAGKRVTDSAVTFDFEVTGVPREHEPTVEEHLLRIGQEAVTNAVRHSAATYIAMTLRYDDHTLTLRVVDDGSGFDPGASAAARPGVGGHWGLLTMEERAAAIRGTFRLTSTPGVGTVVEAVVPSHRQRARRVEGSSRAWAPVARLKAFSLAVASRLRLTLTSSLPGASAAERASLDRRPEQP